MNSPGDSGGAFGDGGLTLGDDLVGFGDTFDVAEDFVARALLEDFAFGDGTLGLGAAFLELVCDWLPMDPLIKFPCVTKSAPWLCCALGPLWLGPL